LIADLEKIKYATNPYNVNRLTAAAGIAAVEENQYYLDNCKRIIRDRAFTAEGLTALGFQVIPSKANFLFVRCPALDGEVYYRKLRERGILVRHFDKEKIRQYNRITIGTREEMEKLLAATEEILAEEDVRQQPRLRKEA
jgi:histidinol-phosphate aminotransferase